jgi:hypothetical protein
MRGAAELEMVSDEHVFLNTKFSLFRDFHPAYDLQRLRLFFTFNMFVLLGAESNSLACCA